MHIVLIGNYKLDNQESMERFTLMLAEGFKNLGIDTNIWRPTVLFGLKSLNPHKGIGKYLGYIDKWVIFPIILKFRILKNSKKITTFL